MQDISRDSDNIPPETMKEKNPEMENTQKKKQ